MSVSFADFANGTNRSNRSTATVSPTADGRTLVWYFVVGFWREVGFKIFLRPSAAIKGGPLPVSGRFAAEGHFIWCLSGPEGGGEVDVASYIPGPARRGPVCG